MFCGPVAKMKTSLKPNPADSRVLKAGELSANDVIRFAQEGDPDALERLYHLHSSRVYRLCLHMVKNPTEAEDLTQNAFLQTFRKIKTFRGEACFSTWLHRLTVNVVLMHLRKKRRSELSLDGTLETDDESPKPSFEPGGPDLNLNGVIDRINLQNAIDQLPRGYRKALILHDIQGCQHNEISRILGCSVGNSKSQLHKARQRLSKLLPGNLETAS
jgi:RNA polymerase sigma-70 factor, ECF subfamily